MDIRFEGQAYTLAGQSLLDCLNIASPQVPSGCRAGVCQSCLVRAVSGAVPPRAQAGLPEHFVARGLFLACQCWGEDLDGPLEVAGAESALQRFETRVRAVLALGPDTRALHLDTPPGYDYRAGQFVQLWRDAQARRNYSLASVPGIDEGLVLHVRRVPGGEVSTWIFNALQAGDRLTISEARGHCFYSPGRPGQGLLLIGTGTGIAPLAAIVRDAIAQGHAGPIHLVYGGRDAAGLYLNDTLQALAARHGNLHYQARIAPARPDDAAADLIAGALAAAADLSGWRVYLCGNPAMVEKARVATFLAGAASSEIFADPFLPTGTAPAAGVDLP